MAEKIHVVIDVPFEFADRDRLAQFMTEKFPQAEVSVVHKEVSEPQVVETLVEHDASAPPAETAEAIAKELGAPLEVRPALTEVPAGEWTGKTYQQLEGDPRWRRYNDNRSGTRPPGGELMLETQTRIVAELLCLREQHPQDTIAVVSHGDPIRAALMYFLGMPMDLFHRIEISTAAFSVLRLEQWGAQVLSVNEGAE